QHDVPELQEHDAQRALIQQLLAGALGAERRPGGRGSVGIGHRNGDVRDPDDLRLAGRCAAVAGFGHAPAPGAEAPVLARAWHVGTPWLTRRLRDGTRRTRHASRRTPRPAWRAPSAPRG